MFKNISKAFTLAETLFAVLVLGIVAALMMHSLKGVNENVDEAKLAGETAKFYQEAETITASSESHKKITTSVSAAAGDFAKYYMDRLGSYDAITCPETITGATTVTDLSCYQLHSGTVVAFKYAPACNMANVQIKEYFEKEHGRELKEEINKAKNAGEAAEQAPEEIEAAVADVKTAKLGEIQRTVGNSCGYILYATKDSLKDAEKNGAMIGINVFTISIGDGFIK